MDDATSSGTLSLVAAIARRKMVRTFASRALESKQLDELLDRARRAPSAGNTAATGYVVLDTPKRTAAYWDITLPSGPARTRFRWQGLLDAPALVIVTVDPTAYLERYREHDKATTGRGVGFDAWPVPYWWVDAGAVLQNLLLLSVDAGWGACLFGAFDHEPALRERFGLPERTRMVATVALGYPSTDEPGRSQQRPRPPLSQILIRPDVGNESPDSELAPEEG